MSFLLHFLWFIMLIRSSKCFIRLSVPSSADGGSKISTTSLVRRYPNLKICSVNRDRREVDIHSTKGRYKLSNQSARKQAASEGFRINKCLGTLSRRGADAAILEGRVTLNGKIAQCGDRVVRGDTVKLDGKLQRWETTADARQQAPVRSLDERTFAYVKYWKQKGVTCTSDPRDSSNILSAGKFNLFPQRMFTVGRLDKDSTGLILLTSDGRVNHALLSPSMKKEKEYVVSLNRVPSDEQVAELAAGVVITTTVQRDAHSVPVTARTLPCRVTRVGGPQSSELKFVLTEGRNRQIRRMVEAVGLSVVTLHRTRFCGIGLKGLSVGNWAELDETEMDVVKAAMTEHLHKEGINARGTPSAESDDHSNDD